MAKRHSKVIRAAILLDQSRGNWHELNHAWQHSGTRFKFPVLVGFDKAERYLVIAGISQATLSELGAAQEQKGFDPNKPVIWIDHTRRMVDIFGSTSLLMAEIRQAESDKERGIRRLIEHLSGSSQPEDR